MSTLLEELQKTLGCTYLSDLQYESLYHRQTLLAVIHKMPPDSFPLEEWNQALTYIFRQPCQLNSQEELHAFLNE